MRWHAVPYPCPSTLITCFPNYQGGVIEAPIVRGVPIQGYVWQTNLLTSHYNDSWGTKMPQVLGYNQNTSWLLRMEDWLRWLMIDQMRTKPSSPIMAKPEALRCLYLVGKILPPSTRSSEAGWKDIAPINKIEWSLVAQSSWYYTTPPNDSHNV